MEEEDRKLGSSRRGKGKNGVHKMSNFIMRIFVSIFLISIKSYSLFFLLLFPEENVMEMNKNATLPYVQYTTLCTCQAQLKHWEVLPWLFISPLLEDGRGFSLQAGLSATLKKLSLG